MIKRAKSFAVCRLNTNSGLMKREYTYIKSIEEAETLAQYAMTYKNTGEIAIIIPYENKSIDKDPESLAEAVKLAKIYKEEDNDTTTIGCGPILKSVIKAIGELYSLLIAGKDVEVCEKKRN